MSKKKKYTALELSIRGLNAPRACCRTKGRGGPLKAKLSYHMRLKEKKFV
jgi:hypothetical protein